MTRDEVFVKLGPPYVTLTESDGAICDYYKLYTRGYGAGGKIPIAVTEAAADFFTIGLAEIVLTPTEGMTKNEKHPVAFCYVNQKLVRVTFEGMPSATAAATPSIAALESDTPPNPAMRAVSERATVFHGDPETGQVDGLKRRSVSTLSYNLLSYPRNNDPQHDEATSGHCSVGHRRRFLRLRFVRSRSNDRDELLPGNRPADCAARDNARQIRDEVDYQQEPSWDTCRRLRGCCRYL